MAWSDAARRAAAEARRMKGRDLFRPTIDPERMRKFNPKAMADELKRNPDLSSVRGKDGLTWGQRHNLRNPYRAAENARRRKANMNFYKVFSSGLKAKYQK